jgi:hypothetical protein
MKASRVGLGVGLGVAAMLLATGCSSPTDTAVNQPPVANTVPGDIPTPDIDIGGFTNCQTEYGELIKKMITNPGKISAEESQRWSEQAKKAGEQAANGDLDGAQATICGTVDEMNKALDS